MAADDLTRPLGLRLPRAPNRKRLYGIVAGVGMVAVAAGATAYLLGTAPGPTETVPIAAPGPAAVAVADRTSSIQTAPGQPAPDTPGLTEVTTSGGVNTPDRVVIYDPSNPAPITLAALPDDALVETGSYGPLPKIAADGRRPLEVYSRPYDGRGDARIALVVGGLGVDRDTTERAIRNLPGTVTLAFAPYGDNMAAWLEMARANGHEILLQVPLDPYSYPSVDPGPHTLTTDATADQNVDHLHWLLSRMTTYVGVINYMGARFTSETAALAPVLEEIGSRGLVYVDDGSSPRSQTAAMAIGRAPFLQADAVLDADLSAAAIDSRLADLQTIARERGHAVATATAFPVTIERIAAFAKVAADRGITLVPVSALAGSVGR